MRMGKRKKRKRINKMREINKYLKKKKKEILIKEKKKKTKYT
jgi:hypothetical protein